MGRAKARFRLALKDQASGESLKVELIDSPGLWGERRYRIRVNGKAAKKVEDVIVTEVFHRLRGCLVRRVKGAKSKR